MAEVSSQHVYGPADGIGHPEPVADESSVDGLRRDKDAPGSVRVRVDARYGAVPLRGREHRIAPEFDVLWVRADAHGAPRRPQRLGVERLDDARLRAPGARDVQGHPQLTGTEDCGVGMATKP